MGHEHPHSVAAGFNNDLYTSGDAFKERLEPLATFETSPTTATGGDDLR